MPLGEKEKQSSTSGYQGQLTAQRKGIALLTGGLSVQRPDQGSQTPSLPRPRKVLPTAPGWCVCVHKDLLSLPGVCAIYHI